MSPAATDRLFQLKYDRNTFQKRKEYAFESSVILTSFSEDGKRLLVVTADQNTYLIDPAISNDTGAVASK